MLETSSTIERELKARTKNSQDSKNNFNTYTRLKNRLEMTPALIVPSLLVLVCLHLQAEAAMGSGEVLWCNKTTVANLTAITQGTGREALNAKSIATCYLEGNAFCEHPPIEGMSLDRVNECENISLIDIPSGSGLQGTADAVSNLNKLLYMYRSVWRYMALSESALTETDFAKLDLLETLVSRLSNQAEWYLQFHNCSCNYSHQCTVQDGIDKNSIHQEIHNLQTTVCTPKMLLNVIIQDFQNAAIDILKSLPGVANDYSLRPYQFCHSVETLPIPCKTLNFTCNTSK